MSKLSQRDVDFNQTVLADLFAAQDLPVAKDQQPLLDAVSKFAADNEISFRNTTQTEENNLMAEMVKASNFNLEVPAESAKLDALLAQWKKTLSVNAIYGQGSEEYKGQVVGMAASLLATGSIPAGFYATETDFRQCLQGIEVPPFARVLEPTSLTDVLSADKKTLSVDAKQEIQDKLESALAGLKDNHPVTLYLPVNSGRSHWRLVKAEVRNKQLSEVTLWDSMGPNGAFKSSNEYANLHAAVDALTPAGKKIAVQIDQVGVQKKGNGYSCLDFVTREVMLGLLVENSLTEPQSAKAETLRLEMAKLIARNTPTLGEAVAKTLKYDATGAICNPQFVAIEAAENEAKADSQIPSEAAVSVMTKEEAAFKETAVAGYQVEFDEELAKNLKQAYEADKNPAHDKVLFERAVAKTVRETMRKGGLGFFAAKKSPSEPSSPAPEKDEVNSNKPGSAPK